MTGSTGLIEAIKCLFGITETETNRELYKRPIHYLNEAILANGMVTTKEVTNEYKRPIQYLYEALEAQNVKAA